MQITITRTYAQNNNMNKLLVIVLSLYEKISPAIYGCGLKSKHPEV